MSAGAAAKRVRQFFSSLILPPAGPLLLAAIAVALQPMGPMQYVGIGALGFLWLLGCSTPLTWVASWWLPAPRGDLADSTQAIIIPGRGVRANTIEFAGPHLPVLALERVVYAAHLARRHDVPIAVSGGDPHGVGVSEATVMTRVLADLSVEARWLEHEALDTWQNALLLKVLLEPDGIERVAVVTQALDARRAEAVMRRAGFDATAMPIGRSERSRRGLVGFVPDLDSLTDATILAYELLGCVYYAFRGRMAWRDIWRPMR